LKQKILEREPTFKEKLTEQGTEREEGEEGEGKERDGG
jgi:hypothetical protein